LPATSDFIIRGQNLGLLKELLNAPVSLPKLKELAMPAMEDIMSRIHSQPKLGLAIWFSALALAFGSQQMSAATVGGRHRSGC